MKAIKTLILLGLTVHTCGMCWGQCTTQCPPCFYDATAPAGHGISNQRTLEYVFIDSSWDDPPGSGHTNTNVWNGVNDAINQWNNTQDVNSCYGRPYINYWFQLNQQNGSQADVVITNGGRMSVCGQAVGPPYRIALPSFFNQRDAYTVISPLVQHELGHTIGLDESYGVSHLTCQSAASIMRGVQDLLTCLPNISSIASIDVAQSNRNLTNRSSCQDTWQTQNDRQEPSPCPSQNFCSQNGYFNPDDCTYGTDNGGCGAYAQFLPGKGPEGADCCSAASPIIIDIGGNGFDLTDSADGVLFDFFGIGKKVQIAWTAAGSQNAFLILDRNGNGLIDSAQEMFGNMTEQPVSENPNGFIALSVFDKPENGGNGDGVIDKNDTIFSKLQVWQDVNHDGVSQPNELRLLNEVGIISISLKYHESRWSDIYGNAFRYRSRVTFSPERPSTWVYDVFLLLAPR